MRLLIGMTSARPVYGPSMLQDRVEPFTDRRSRRGGMLSVLDEGIGNGDEGRRKTKMRIKMSGRIGITVATCLGTHLGNWARFVVRLGRGFSHTENSDLAALSCSCSRWQASRHRLPNSASPVCKTFAWERTARPGIGRHRQTTQLRYSNVLGRLLQ